MKEHNQDVCECGDYRSQHNEYGVCNLNGLGHGIPFNEGKCFEFRLAYSHLANYDVYDNLYGAEDESIADLIKE